MSERYQSYVLDRRITLLGTRDTGDRSGWNQHVTEPVEIEVWAGRRDVTATERVTSADSIVSQLRSRYVIRYRTDIDANWRIRDDGVVSGIEGIREINRRRYLELLTRSNSR